MSSLYAYSNVENTALVLIQRKGFQIWFDDEEQLYYAEKDGWDFAAAGAVELLGTIAIFEHHNPEVFKEYWWRIENPVLISNLPKHPSPYVPVWSKKDDEEKK